LTSSLKGSEGTGADIRPLDSIARLSDAKF
jgi:hypothetical protein